MKPCRAAAVQVGPGGITPERLDALLSRERGLDLVVLPELGHLPYFPLEHRSAHLADAATIDGPVVSAFGAVAAARRVHLVLALYLAEGDRRFNAAVVIGPDGMVLTGRDLGGAPRTSYRKVHLCTLKNPRVRFYEEEYFAPGEGHVLWDTPFGTLGVIICYDRHFPEAWRTLRAADVDIACVPIASPELSRTWFVAEMQTMAMQQGLYVIAPNRAGEERLATSGLVTRYVGLSCVVAPDGEVLAQAPEGAPDVIAAADLDPDRLARYRIDHHYFEDRRPETYLSGPAGEER